MERIEVNAKCISITTCDVKRPKRFNRIAKER